MPTPNPNQTADAAGSKPEPASKPLDALASAPSPSPDPIDADLVKQPVGGGHVIAPGRTVDGKGPGETVHLDEADAKRFVELGFVLDKDGGQRVPTEGPAVNVEDGVQVKQAKQA